MGDAFEHAGASAGLLTLMLPFSFLRGWKGLKLTLEEAPTMEQNPTTLPQPHFYQFRIPTILDQFHIPTIVDQFRIPTTLDQFRIPILVDQFHIPTILEYLEVMFLKCIGKEDAEAMQYIDSSHDFLFDSIQEVA